MACFSLIYKFFFKLNKVVFPVTSVYIRDTSLSILIMVCEQILRYKHEIINLALKGLSSAVECWQSFEICYILSHVIEDMGIYTTAVYRQVINSF